MKKCNFLAVLVTALFMVMGFSGFSQTFLPATKAAVMVQDQIEVLKKSSPSMTAQAKTAKTTVLNSVKIAFGEALLEPLKTGQDVGAAIAAVSSRFNSNVPERQAIIDEAGNFYKNLLKKSF